MKKRTNPTQRNKKGKRPSEVAKDDGGAIAEILQAAEKRYEENERSTKAGLPSKEVEDGGEEEAAAGVGASIGPSIGPPGRPPPEAAAAAAAASIGPSIGPPGRPEPSADTAAAADSIGPSIGPPRRPPEAPVAAAAAAKQFREKREIAEVEDAPEDALAAATSHPAKKPKKGGKKQAGPILSFGDDD